MLSAVRLPSWGGETEFVDLRAAWDALPERLKAKVEGLEAEHFALHSRMTLLGDTDYTPEQQAALPPVVWPLVRTHPGSGPDRAVRRHPCAADPRDGAGRGEDAAARPAGARDRSGVALAA